MSSMEGMFVGKYAFYKIINNPNDWKFYVLAFFVCHKNYFLLY